MAGRRPNVHELGFISDREALAQVYASAEGFLSPGGQETFGLGIGEALCSGLPVLSADSGAGVQTIRRFGCGLLFRTGDAADLARKAGELVGLDFRTGVETARRHLADNHSWRRVFSTYIDYHEKLRHR